MLLQVKYGQPCKSACSAHSSDKITVKDRGSHRHLLAQSERLKVKRSPASQLIGQGRN